MSNKNIEQFRAMNVDELGARLEEIKSEYKTLKFDHSVKGIENPLTLRELRRNIARIKTELRTRELAK